ncbi:hypothetical protein PLESTM_001591200 [Pleodorina starrii]|nr:hypothetical protein PLESTM_001591200 [Pleodorina starrii]
MLTQHAQAHRAPRSEPTPKCHSTLDLQRSAASLPLPWPSRGLRARRRALAIAAALPCRPLALAAAYHRGRTAYRPNGGLPEATAPITAHNRPSQVPSEAPRPQPPQAWPDRQGSSPPGPPSPPTGRGGEAAPAAAAASAPGPRRRASLWAPDGGVAPDASDAAPRYRDGGPPAGSSRSPPPPLAPSSRLAPDSASARQPRAAPAPAPASAVEFNEDDDDDDDGPIGSVATGGAVRSSAWRSAPPTGYGRYNSGALPRRADGNAPHPRAWLPGATDSTRSSSSSSNRDGGSGSSGRGGDSSGRGGSGRMESSPSFPVPGGPASSSPASSSPAFSPPSASARSDRLDDLGYSQRVARLRKPVLTAPDKLGLEPEERARIYRALRTPRRRVTLPGGSGRPAGPPWTRPPPPGLPSPAEAGGPGWSAQHPGAASSASGRGPGLGAAAASPPPPLPLPLPLRVFCYGIDDVRLYRALEGGDAVGLVVVVPEVAAADAVWATRTKRTGKAVSLVESLPGYLAARAGAGDLPPPLLRELDCTDLYDSREGMQPVNPQEREARRQAPIFRPYMKGSRMARKGLVRQQLRRRTEAEGAVPW